LETGEAAREAAAMARCRAGRFDADIAQPSVELDGADDRVRRGADDGSVFEDTLEIRSEPSGAAAEESGGVRVPVESTAIIEAKAFGDGGGACPSEEFAFDRIALRVAANDALAGVTGRRAAG
jgi:hypothetical protein